MPTAYFDTNVYIIGILQPNSNSRLILQEIKKGNIKVVLSDYLIDEVLAWFKIHIDDLPHICSYFAGEADYFVTANRRLTEMKIKEHVTFMSAKKFIEDVCGLIGIDTVKGI